MYCPKCGKENKEGSVFCGGCGAQFGTSQTAANNMNGSEPLFSNVAQKTSGVFAKLENNIGKVIKMLGKIEIVLGLICLVIAIIAFIDCDEWTFTMMLTTGLVALLSALPIIGFGVLLEDVHEIRKKM